MPAPPAEPPVMRQKSHPPRQPKAIAKGQRHPRNRPQGRSAFPLFQPAVLHDERRFHFRILGGFRIQILMHGFNILPLRQIFLA